MDISSDNPEHGFQFPGVFEITAMGPASAGLEVLVNAHRLAGSGTRLAVVADGPATSRPIQITGVDDYVPLFATANAAMAALIGGPPSA